MKLGILLYGHGYEGQTRQSNLLGALEKLQTIPPGTAINPCQCGASALTLFYRRQDCGIFCPVCGRLGKLMPGALDAIRYWNERSMNGTHLGIATTAPGKKIVFYAWELDNAT